MPGVLAAQERNLSPDTDGAPAKRPLTLRSKPFALVVVANVPSSVPVVRAGRDSCAWRSGHFATLELRESKMRRDQSRGTS